MNLDAALDRLADDPTAPIDVAVVALHLARDEYPDLDIPAYLERLEALARQVRPWLRGGLAHRVAGLCRFLFEEQGFHGNEEDYYDPRNSYLNEVLDRRTGLPITLSVVAMAVGTRAGLDVAGVGLPGHFIAKATAGAKAVLFDPFHGGRQLTAADCAELVEQATGMPFKVTAFDLQATPPGLVIQRLLNNLKGVYLRRRDFPRAARVIARLCQLAPNDPLQQRDLGVTLYYAGQPGPAIDPLTAYLHAIPTADDRRAVEQLLTQARQELARWN
jgi:regulator of sirC expression with transglutaminase-like and TPR domain